MWLALLLTGLASAQTAPNDAVIHALSMRHAQPCAEIEALTPTPVSTLLRVVDDVPLPPWSAMRAAECLIVYHPAEIRERLDAWVVSPELQGLGRIVLSELDALPVEIAVPIAQLALSKGPIPEAARKYVLNSKIAEIRAVAEVAQ